MKKLLIIGLSFFCAVCVKAQYVNELAVDKQYPDNEKAADVYQSALERQADTTASAVRTTWVANKPGDNWFFSLEGGAAWLGSENYVIEDFKDYIQATYGIALGKWFSPVWGLRLNVGGAKLKGNSKEDGTWYIGQNHPGADGIASAKSYLFSANTLSETFVRSRFLDESSKNSSYSYEFMYGAASVDFLLNLKNLFSAYNPDAFFNPVLYGGFGYAHTFKDGDRTAVNSIMEKIGLQFNFKLSSHLEAYLVGETLIVPEVFDRYVGGDKTEDIVVNAKVGLTYHFGYSGFIKAPLIDQKQLDALNAEINNLRSQIK
jgi:hypothetical protein